MDTDKQQYSVHTYIYGMLAVEQRCALVVKNVIQIEITVTVLINCNIN